MFSILIRFPSLNICLTYSPMGTGCFRRAHEVKPHHGISQRLHGFLDGCFGSSFSRSGCSSSGPRELFSARSRESWRCKSMQAGERTHLTDYLVLLRDENREPKAQWRMPHRGNALRKNNSHRPTPIPVFTCLLWGRLWLYLTGKDTVRNVPLDPLPLLRTTVSMLLCKCSGPCTTWVWTVQVPYTQVFSINILESFLWQFKKVYSSL